MYICNGCNMGMRDLSDMYVRSPKAVGPGAEGIYIRQIMLQVLCITLFPH